MDRQELLKKFDDYCGKCGVEDMKVIEVFVRYVLGEIKEVDEIGKIVAKHNY